jgi:hypothetical protein
MMQDTCDKICKDFKVTSETVATYEKVYTSKIQFALRQKYISHLVSTISDIVILLYKYKQI